MTAVIDVNQIHEKVLKIKQLLKELEAQSESFPALSRNTKRAQASIKMLELNIGDVVDFKLMGSQDVL